MREMKDSGVEWLGEVPAEWDVVPGKRILMLLQRPVEDGDGVVTCFRDGEVTLRANRRTEGFTIALKEIGYQGVEPGDLVVHGMDGFAGSIGISDSRGKASPVLNVMDSDQNKRFLMYYMRGLAYRDVYMALSDGIRVRSCNLSWKKIGNLPFALPPLPVQRRIADYLDEKCDEIDRAVSAAERSIEEYKAYKNSIVNQIITKGLNSDVPMKDSGVEWLGEVPAEWGVVPGKRILMLLHRPVEDGDGVVTCFRDGEVTLRANRRTEGFTIALKEIGYQGVEPGDLVVHGMDGFAGSIGISDSRGKASPVLNVMDSDQNKRFLMYYMRGLAYRDVYMALSDGIRVRSCNLSWKKISNLPFALPSLPVQSRIADYLDEKCAEIDRAVSAKQAIIADLKAYKQSLIYEVVTGKREV